MDDKAVMEVLTDYVQRELLHGDARGLDENSPLLDWGVIESLSMAALIAFVEQTFGVRLGDDEVTPENFVNLRAITDLVVRHLPRGSQSA